MKLKEKMKKEKYVLRFYRKNIVLSNIVEFMVGLSVIAGPLVTFILGSMYPVIISEFGIYSNEEEWLVITVFIVALVPFIIATIAVKFVYPDLYKVESAHREDIVIDLAVDKMKETFEKFLEEHSPFITIEIPEPKK